MRAFLLVAALSIASCKSCDDSAPARPAEDATAEPLGPIIFEDKFEGEAIDPAKWAFVREGDFREAVVEQRAGKLVFSADTVGRRRETMKTVGVRTAAPIDVSRGVRIDLVINWQDLANTAYARAVVAFSSEGSSRAPSLLGSAITFEYIGIPGSPNSRFMAMGQKRGRITTFESEGWPEKRGRPIGRLALSIYMDPKQFRSSENGREVVRRDGYGLDTEKVYLYIAFSTAAGFPMRALSFEHLTVRQALLTDFAR